MGRFSLQASLEHLMETEAELADAFLNRLFALLNWTLTEFTISSQVSHILCQPFVNLKCPVTDSPHACTGAYATGCSWWVERSMLAMPKLGHLKLLFYINCDSSVVCWHCRSWVTQRPSSTATSLA